MAEPRETCEPLIIGRYALYDEIASGGMATVHLGRLLGAAGFSRVVAVKRLHRQYAKNPEFVAMFVDEARLAARIRHPNVVPTLDVVRTADELFLVMEYVGGESLSSLMRVVKQRSIRVAPGIAASIAIGMLQGLHAAHTAHGEQGEPLEIVHRDVSPQNVIVGTDGIARVLDFGIAKARVRVQTTRDGQIKGKLGYVSPEQLRGLPVGPFTDVYAASVVLWEMLAGRKLFDADEEAALLMQVLNGPDEPPSKFTKGLPRALDEVVMRGLAGDPSERFATAKEMATAVERACRPASAQAVGEWVEWLAAELLQERTGRISIIESDTDIKVLADVVTPIQAVPPDVSSSSRGPGRTGPTSDAVGQLGAGEVAGSPSGRFSPAPARTPSSGAGGRDASSSDLIPTVITGPDAVPSEARRAAGGPPLSAPHRRDRRLVVGLGIAVAALATVIVVMAVRSGSEESNSLAPSSEPDAADATVGAHSSLPAPTAAPADPSSTPSTQASPASSSVTPASSSDASAAPTAAPSPSPTKTRAPVGTSTSTAPAVKPKVDCSIPYVVDKDGIRHVRPECVE